MAETADHLRLVQWLSPAFPIGAFAWSQGLEVAILDGDVTDAGTLHDWIAAILTHGALRAGIEGAALTAGTATGIAMVMQPTRQMPLRRNG